MAHTLSLAQARRVAIAAQGLDRPRPETVTMRHITATIARTGLLQIDSVNVLARAHLLPLFARLGPYDTELFDRAASQAPRRVLETWAHEASFVPATTFPLLMWNRRGWGGMNIDRLESRFPGLFDRVLGIIAQHGPMTSRQIEAHLAPEHSQRPTGQWGWSWTPAKTAMEILFDAGHLTPARRNAQFERVYDLTERVLPPKVRNQPVPDKAEAIVELVRIAARAHGIGTIRCFADYFRLKQDETRRAVAYLEFSKELIPVDVRGWQRQTWMHARARVPRVVNARALLAPFDPLVFERRRLQELFGMRYRLEIYTPAVRRIYGYYVLPFLLGDQLVARVDLKHDRNRQALVVASAHAERSEPAGSRSADRPDGTTVAAALAAELRQLARWLGADRIQPSSDIYGDLAQPLQIALQQDH